MAAELFPGLLGLWIALAPIKFGNPVILDRQVAVPQSITEAIYQSWPAAWGHALLVLVAIVGAVAHLPFGGQAKPRSSTPHLLDPTERHWRQQGAGALPWLCLGWCCWQTISAWATVDPSLSRPVLSHFLACGLTYLMGYRMTSAAAETPSSRSFWLGVAGGWLVVVAIGWRQHFGGLAETREYFYSLPDWRTQPPELIAKIASERIYSTLVYPNALAGAVLLTTPPLVLGIWALSRRWNAWVRMASASVLVMGAAGCLVWSGSKAGWLIALAVVAVAWLVRAAWSRSGVRWLWLVAGLAVALGLFWHRYHDYFARGATSASARVDYWRVAWSNSTAHPLLGTGPGTFMRIYSRAKPPTAEMTRLVHNDYLQQATDSGWPGAILFAGLAVGALVCGYRRDLPVISFGIWLGVLGISGQSLVEFGLYIPGLAWPWFLGLGYLSRK